MLYQKCPVCDGTGLVSRPPGIAGDQEYWISSSTGTYTCKCCNGSGLILQSPNNAMHSDGEGQCNCKNGYSESTGGCPVHGVKF